MAAPHVAVSFAPCPRSIGLPEVVDYMNRALALVQRALSPSVGTLRLNSTTPDVGGSSVWKTNSSSATSITALKGGIPEQEILLCAVDGNTTLVHSTSSLVLLSGSNVTMISGTFMRLVTLDGTVWSET